MQAAANQVALPVQTEVADFACQTDAVEHVSLDAAQHMPCHELVGVIAVWECEI